MRGPPARKAEPSEMSLAVRARLVLIPCSSRSQHLQISLPLSVHEVQSLRCPPKYHGNQPQMGDLD